LGGSDYLAKARPPVGVRLEYPVDQLGSARPAHQAISDSISNDPRAADYERTPLCPRAASHDHCGTGNRLNDGLAWTADPTRQLWTGPAFRRPCGLGVLNEEQQGHSRPVLPDYPRCGAEWRAPGAIRLQAANCCGSRAAIVPARCASRGRRAKLPLPGTLGPRKEIIVPRLRRIWGRIQGAARGA